MQQGGGGSQYGVSPEMTQYAAAAAAAAAASTGRTHLLGISSSEHLQLQQQQHMIQKSGGDPATLAEAASPISSRPPPRNLDELPPGASSFADEEALAGEESERGPPGNRWPRQETLALLKIRSEMDAAFRDATLKGPLWEDVSRKLAELGYIRNAKKCKEKFENVHKYYKRTKEGRAGRQDGKSYRFFSQLEALHSSAGGGGGGGGAITMLPSTTGLMATSSNPLAATPISVGMAAGINPMIGSSGRVQPTPVSSAPPSQIGMQRIVHDSSVGAATGGASGSVRTAGISFSSNSSSSNDDSDEDMDEGGPSSETRKRKRSESEGPSQKMMIFFEGLMKQVMERQEAMQQRFLETIEKREQDKMIREEAWRRQEMARLSREHELMAQERAMAASRDAAVIAFLQKITGQNIQMQPAAVAIPAAPPQQTAPPPAAAAAAPAQQQHHIHHAPPTQPTPPPQPQSQLQLQQQSQSQSLPQSQSSKIMPQQQPQSQSSEIVPHHPPSPPKDMMVVHIQQPHHQPQYQQPQEIVAATSFDPTSSRWPKTEVLALIKLRSGLESRYQEAGPKGPLWEEISAGMQRMGYNRSAKRCKEKWENINKYFKKVKESNKKRPEDAKTCPYFHQLDALYRRKMVGVGSSSGAATQTRQDQEIDTANEPCPLAIMPPSMAQPTNLTENKSGGSGEGKDGDGSNLQVPTSNGGQPPSFFEEGSLKKPEDIVKELMEQHQHQSVMDDYDKLEGADSVNMDQEEDDEDDDDDDGEHEEESKMDYKIQFQRQNASSSKGEGNVGATQATVSPFLAMVQ